MAEQATTVTIETAMLEIWRRCFESSEIGTDADFIALGGDSLKAILLIGMCNDRFGTALPASALLQHRTAASLAGAVAGTSERAGAANLLILRQGAPRSPVLLVHPLGGTVFCYSHLVFRLPADRPVYGLQASGLQPGERLPRSIEDMAAQYRVAVQAAGLTQPWHLAGWSFGGLVAFEMARQSLAAGGPVASLTLVETQLPAARFGDDDEDLTTTSVAAALKLDLSTGGLARGRPSLDSMIEAAATRPGADRMPADEARRTVEVVRNCLRLRRLYRPGQLRGAVTLVRASAEPGARDENFDWSRHVDGPLRRHHLPATHESILSPPHVERLAELLNDLVGADPVA